MRPYLGIPLSTCLTFWLKNFVVYSVVEGLPIRFGQLISLMEIYLANIRCDYYSIYVDMSLTISLKLMHPQKKDLPCLRRTSICMWDSWHAIQSFFKTKRIFTWHRRSCATTMYPFCRLPHKNFSNYLFSYKNLTFCE